MRCLRLISSKGSLGWLGGLILGMAGSFTSVAAERQANTTLNFPEQLPAGDFVLEDGFPGLRFSNPVGIFHAPGEDHRLFILEKIGRIRMVTLNDNPERSTFMSITDRVRSGGEQGLLGLAFHPDFANNGYFYVFYTARDSGAPNRLSRFQVAEDDPNRGLPETEQILINQRDDAGNHNGGDIHFGPDGYLYVALGDEGAANDTLNNSQRIDRDFFAGILRIDVDKRPGSLPPNSHAAASDHYAIPPDNPFVGASSFLGEPVNPDRVRTEFWAVGLRNPWRMAFDPVTGLLYTGDVGQGRLEEVDIIVKGGNYGWNFLEGTFRGPKFNQAPEGFQGIPPVLEYRHGSGTDRGNSITGGVVYRGDRFSELYGAYLFADFVSGNIWAMRHEGNQSTEWRHLTRDSGIAAFGTDPRQGDVLLADHNSGRIMRLVASEETPGAELPPTLAETGAFRDLATMEPHAGIEPYEINTPFWSDHALKKRWFSLPDPETTLGFRADQPWTFPHGSVWIKHFDMEMVRGDPASTRRLETRFLIRSPDGIYGLTYRWDEAQENAVLVDEAGMDETLVIRDGDQDIEQVWRYPSRSECLACHTPAAGLALAFHTAQLNRTVSRDGEEVSQIAWLKRAGYIEGTTPPEDRLAAMRALDDTGVSLTRRVKSYLASNCSQCHRPGGEALGRWDARYTTPILESGLLDGHVVRDEGRADQRLIVPGDLERSEIYRRITDPTRRMPPVASHVLDEAGAALLRTWIEEVLPRKSYPDWSRQFFGEVPAQEIHPFADTDRDGWLNVSEYYLGTDPTWARDRWRMQLDVASGIVTFPQVDLPGLTLTLQTAGNLDPDTTWQSVDLSETRPADSGYARMQQWHMGDAQDDAAFVRSIMDFPDLPREDLLP